MAWPVPWLAWGVLLGAALQLGQPQLWGLSAYAGLLLVSLLAALAAGWAGRRGRAWHAPRSPNAAWLRWGRWAVLTVVATAAMASVCGLRALAFQGQALAPALEGRDLQVTGMVVAMPQSSEAGLRFRLAVESAHAAQSAQPSEAADSVQLPPLIELAWYAGGWGGADAPGEPQRQAQARLQAGQRWAFTVRLKAPHGARNPQGFDYELWLWEQGVQATGYVRSGPRDPQPRLLEATWRYPVEQWRQQVRDAIVQRLAPQEPGDSGALARTRAAGVVAALVTGDQRAIDRADWDLFRATGVAHLMSISGLHITLFAWLAVVVLGWAWRRSARLCSWWPAPHAALVGGVLLATAYALFSGWGLPAQRTVGMLALVAGLRLAGRRWPWPQVWLMVCAAVVLADPWALAQPGFWLSFVAVGVLFASDFVAVGSGGTRTSSRFDFIFRFLREQWVVTLALTPLTLLLFGQVSVVGALANLLAIPWVTLVVTPLALVGVLWAPLWQAAAAALAPMVAWLQLLAGWSGAVVSLPAAPLWAGVAAVVGGTCLALRWPWQLRVLGLPLLVPVLLWPAELPKAGRFSLLAVDVGQGNAVLVRTAGHALLFDAGPRYSAHSDAGARTLVPLLRALGVQLDVLLLSHRDSDHTGGAAAVLAAQPHAALMGSITEEPALTALRPATACVAGQRWEWDGVRFDVQHPGPEPALPTARANTRSCVLRITDAQGVSALLAGDIEAAQEQALVARQELAGAPLQAALLLVPHHGSKTSSSDAFLDAVAPRTALVQAGYRNRFGHPAPEVAARYAQRGIHLVATAGCGAVHWVSAQPAHWQCERAQQRRYWQHVVP
jgi:competence protein ComEC